MKLRSFENEAGNPVDRRLWQEEQTNRMKADAEYESVRDEGVENYLETIDFQAVDRVFREECLKSDSDVGDDAPISRGMIFLSKENNKYDQAEHHALSRIIELFPENIRNQAKEYGVNLESWLLFTLFHEIAHDYSFTVHKGVKEYMESNSIPNILKDMIFFWEKQQEHRMVKMSGYNRKETMKNFSNKDGVGQKLLKENEFHIRFDEGVTDKVALEMMEKYRNYHPEAVSQENLNKLKEKMYSPEEKSGHGQAMGMVDGTITEISQLSGVTEDAVWEAVKRGKFGKENFNDKETMKILQTELPPPVYRKMTR